MQVGQDVLDLVLINLVGESGHHAPPLDNTLDHVLVSGGEPAGKVVLLEKLFESRAFVAAGRIRRMAAETVNIVDASSPALLLIQPQFSICHLSGILAASRQQAGQNHHQKNGRYSLQMTIMSGAQRFENPWNLTHRCFLMPVEIKRAYEKPSLSDGQRVLVDRLWPRGIAKDSARIGHWLKNLAPSETLRKWFHSSANWIVFKKRYFKELETPAASADLQTLYHLLNEHDVVTLVYASKDSEHNNAVALKELLEGMKKPPSSSGPAKAMAVPRRMAKRRPS